MYVYASFRVTSSKITAVHSLSVASRPSAAALSELAWMRTCAVVRWMP